MRRGLVAFVAFAGSVASAACAAFDERDAARSSDPGAEAPESGSADGEASADGSGADGAVEGSVADAFAEAAEAGTIPPTGKLVFVTKGKLASGGSDFITRATNLCNAEAAANGRAAQYAPWLSTGALSAFGRVSAVAGGQWYLRDGTPMGGAPVFATGALPHAINRLANGALAVSDVDVWTGTTSKGLTTMNCSDWTVSVPLESGESGLYVSGDATWTAAHPLGCDSLARVYCFEK